MSLATLEKRLSRVEKDAAHILTPEKPKTSVLLRGITEDATEAEQKRFAVELKNAKARYDLVIVLQPVKPKHHIHRPGIEFVNNELEADLAVATNLPSEQGLTNRLADVLDGLSGNVFNPVPWAMQPKS